MKDPIKTCPDCGMEMTLLLNSFVCDWCDGTVADEWDDELYVDTQPMSFGIELEPFDGDLILIDD